ncbi:transporter [Variovorax sp. WS11]|uniref:BON domain-containing protein n=1 Tax=Variovorax sp. WS11 TaxID=1105204 RepID=UPI000D0D2372|nr:BON domain-containing protein [Variovorax sp. WS11]NDZ16220.1 BON domain-containing protein [Variovorax sp. WS11]PSL84005.1 transporter [Variovorax sp. WS11]
MITSISTRSRLALMLASGILVLAACDKGGNQTAGEKLDSAIAKTEQAGDQAKAKADRLAREAQDKAASSSTSAESTIKREAQDATAAAKTAGATVAGVVDDATITAAVSAGLAKDPDLSATRIDVDTKGGTVMLKGPAPNAAAKSRATEIAKAVKGVGAVDNQLEVKTM